MDLKNLKIEDLKPLIMQYADKKTLIKIGISAGAVIFFLIIYYAILNPIVNKKKLQLTKMNEMKAETTEFVNNIATIKAKIKQLTPKYENYSTLFHTRAEVEGLYETLSYYAGINGLVISKIEKKDIKEVSKTAALAKAEGKKVNTAKAKVKKKKDVAYYTIPVNFEINGNFLGYIKFKRALSLSNKMLNFDKESIKVVQGDSTGAIRVSGILTIVGLTDEFF
jgi:Tfp pilus assembly protein PilO|tara:strand:+ start:538 stop:1206 length:669 start_codon:yes stop_codon:yes gene_type:complete